MRKGFAPVIILVLIVLAALIGVGAFYFGRTSGGNPSLSQNFGQNQPIGNNNPTGSIPRVANDESYFTVTSNSKSWPVGSLIAKNASVPTLIELSNNLGNFKKGDILVYFVDFSNYSGVVGSEKLSFISSKDEGNTWSNRTTINLMNKQNHGAAVDPTVVQLSNGKLRLYFFGSDVSANGIPSGSNTHKVYSATSADGVNFTVESGVRFSDTNLTDPQVNYFNNQWLMYYSIGNNSKLAVSNDGLNFQTEALNGNVGGVPGALVVDGGVRLYGCTQGGIEVSYAADGKTFTQEASDVFNGQVAACDPSIIQSSTGKFFAVYKVNSSPSQQEGQQMPSQAAGAKQPGRPQRPGGQLQPQGGMQPPSGGQPGQFQ